MAALVGANYVAIKILAISFTSLYECVVDACQYIIE